jgi:hypothetical protein
MLAQNCRPEMKIRRFVVQQQDSDIGILLWRTKSGIRRISNH